MCKVIRMESFIQYLSLLCDGFNIISGIVLVLFYITFNTIGIKVYKSHIKACIFHENKSSKNLHEIEISNFKNYKD